MSKALDDMENQDGAIRLNCLAHSAELLVRDFASLWPDLMGKAEALANFFKVTHYAAALYKSEMEDQNAKSTTKEKFTMLRRAAATRWGTKTMLLRSLLRNRTVIENVLFRLRRSAERIISLSTTFSTGRILRAMSSTPWAGCGSLQFGPNSSNYTVLPLC